MGVNPPHAQCRAGLVTAVANTDRRTFGDLAMVFLLAFPFAFRTSGDTGSDSMSDSLSSRFSMNTDELVVVVVVVVVVVGGGDGDRARAPFFFNLRTLRALGSGVVGGVGFSLRAVGALPDDLAFDERFGGDALTFCFPFTRGFGTRKSRDVGDGAALGPLGNDMMGSSSSELKSDSDSGFVGGLDLPVARLRFLGGEGLSVFSWSLTTRRSSFCTSECARLLPVRRRSDPRSAITTSSDSSSGSSAEFVLLFDLSR